MPKDIVRQRTPKGRKGFLKSVHGFTCLVFRLNNFQASIFKLFCMKNVEIEVDSILAYLTVPQQTVNRSFSVDFAVFLRTLKNSDKNGFSTVWRDTSIFDRSDQITNFKEKKFKSVYLYCKPA
jgi:hypothetical protein